MIIVRNAFEGAYENIVSFTDLSEISYTSLSYAQDLFNQKDIKVVYAYKQMSEIALQYYNKVDNKEKIYASIQEKAILDVENFEKKYNINNIKSIETQSGVSSALLHFVDTNKNDLVVMGSKGVNNSSAFLYGSVTSYLMENIKSDILIYVPQK